MHLNAVNRYHSRLNLLQHDLCDQHIEALRSHTAEVAAVFNTLTISDGPHIVPALEFQCDELIDRFSNRLFWVHTVAMRAVDLLGEGVQLRPSTPKTPAHSLKEDAVGDTTNVQLQKGPLPDRCKLRKITGKACKPPCAGHSPA